MIETATGLFQVAQMLARNSPSPTGRQVNIGHFLRRRLIMLSRMTGTGTTTLHVLRQSSKQGSANVKCESASPSSGDTYDYRVRPPFRLRDNFPGQQAQHHRYFRNTVR